MTDPAAVVWFHADERGGCRILYELTQTSDLGMRDLKAAVLTVSNTFFPECECVDYMTGVPSPAEHIQLLNVLAPAITLQVGEASLVRKLDVACTWLGRRLKDNRNAVQIDPRCTRLITTLAGGYAFRRVHGQVSGEPDDNLYAALIDAWLGALAHPMVTMPGAREGTDHGTERSDGVYAVNPPV